MKRYITTSILAFIGLMLYAQFDQSFFEIKEYLNTSEEYTYLTAHKDDDIDGSPYVNDSLQAGFIRFNGTWYKDVPIRYDAFNEQMQAKLTEKGLTALDPSFIPVDSIILDDELFVPKNNVTGTNRTIFMVPLYDKQGILLLKRYRVSFKPAENPEGYKAAQPAKYINNLPIFYLEKGNSLTVLKGYSEIAEVFNEDKKEVRKLAKKNNINLKQEKDLVLLFDLLAGF